MTFKFNTTYMIYALSLFIIEVLIALFIKGGFIRHTVGDYLVVILLYFILKSFTTIKTIHAIITVWICAFIIEYLQYINFLKYLKLEHNTLAKIILGSTFHVSDLIAYSLGCITILLFTHYKSKV